ncbi:MAG: hypothetical protein Q4F80_07440 [bacterium]|nr:hypothetical protein [bacterium]
MQGSKEKFIKTLGRIIEKHRKTTGKSIHKISAESFLPKPTWYRAETGQYNDINLTTLWKISEGLEIPCEKLIKELHEALGDDFSLTE